MHDSKRPGSGKRSWESSCPVEYPTDRSVIFSSSLRMKAWRRFHMSMRKAKIVCTIGPASSSPAIVHRLIESGMDAARLNFSHGTHESHATAIAAIRNAAAQRGSGVAIIQDLQGPRIRVGQVPKIGIEVRPGQT